MLHNIDCMYYMSRMDAVDMVLTDIPYDVVNRESGGLRNLDKGDADKPTFPLSDFLDEICRIVRGSVYIFCSTEQVSEIRRRLSEDMTTRLCIWEKNNPSPMNGQHIWLSGVECCVYAKQKGATFNEHCKNTVWKYPTVRGKRHPTEKPLALFKRLVLASSNPNDLIFDPCTGSGTTWEAAHSTGRRFEGCELNFEYYRVALKRMERLKKI